MNALGLINLSDKELKEKISSILNDTYSSDSVASPKLKSFTPSNINILRRGITLYELNLSYTENVFYFGDLTLNEPYYFPYSTDYTIMEASLRFEDLGEIYIYSKYVNPFFPNNILTYKTVHFKNAIFNNVSSSNESFQPSFTFVGICFEII